MLLQKNKLALDREIQYGSYREYNVFLSFEREIPDKAFSFSPSDGGRLRRKNICELEKNEKLFFLSCFCLLVTEEDFVRSRGEKKWRGEVEKWPEIDGVWR